MKLQLPDTRTGKAAVVAMVLGAAMLVVAGFALWGGDSSDSTADAAQNDPSDGAFEPYQGQTYVEDLSKSKSKSLLPGAGGAAGAFDGGGNPFAGGGNDKTPHKVTLSVKSDGAVYLGYRFRDGKQGRVAADKTFSITRTVRGQLPVGQIGVQVLQTGTYATCSVSVDGVVVTTSTAKPTYYVTVCTG